MKLNLTSHRGYVLIPSFTLYKSVWNQNLSPHRSRCMQHAWLSILGRDIQIYGRHAAQIIAVQAERLSTHILRAPSFYSCPIDYCNMQHHSSPLSNECVLASKFIFTYVLMFAPCCSLLLCAGAACSQPSAHTKWAESRLIRSYLETNSLPLECFICQRRDSEINYSTLLARFFKLYAAIIFYGWMV
jgi:hypothetical protein